MLYLGCRRRHSALSSIIMWITNDQVQTVVHMGIKMKSYCKMIRTVYSNMGLRGDNSVEKTTCRCFRQKLP